MNLPLLAIIRNSFMVGSPRVCKLVVNPRGKTGFFFRGAGTGDSFMFHVGGRGGCLFTFFESPDRTEVFGGKSFFCGHGTEISSRQPSIWRLEMKFETKKLRKRKRNWAVIGRSKNMKEAFSV
ncbi:unnamed protein product [Pylaiella littoralis]